MAADNMEISSHCCAPIKCHLQKQTTGAWSAICPPFFQQYEPKHVACNLFESMENSQLPKHKLAIFSLTNTSCNMCYSSVFLSAPFLFLVTLFPTPTSDTDHGQYLFSYYSCLNTTNNCWRNHTRKSTEVHKGSLQLAFKLLSDLLTKCYTFWPRTQLSSAFSIQMINVAHRTAIITWPLWSHLAMTTSSPPSPQIRKALSQEAVTQAGQLVSPSVVCSCHKTVLYESGYP